MNPFQKNISNFLCTDVSGEDLCQLLCTGSCFTFSYSIFCHLLSCRTILSGISHAHCTDLLFLCQWHLTFCIDPPQLLQIKNDKLARQSLLLGNGHSDMSIQINVHDQVYLKLATSLVGAAHKVCRQVLIDRPVTATSPWDLKCSLRAFWFLQLKD